MTGNVFAQNETVTLLSDSNTRTKSQMIKGKASESTPEEITQQIGFSLKSTLHTKYTLRKDSPVHRLCSSQTALCISSFHCNAQSQLSELPS